MYQLRNNKEKHRNQTLYTSFAVLGQTRKIFHKTHKDILPELNPFQESGLICNLSTIAHKTSQDRFVQSWSMLLLIFVVLSTCRLARRGS